MGKQLPLGSLDTKACAQKPQRGLCGDPQACVSNVDMLTVLEFLVTLMQRGMLKQKEGAWCDLKVEVTRLRGQGCVQDWAF